MTRRYPLDSERDKGITRREVMRTTATAMWSACAASFLPFADLAAAAGVMRIESAVRANGRTDEHLEGLMSRALDPVYGELVHEFFKSESSFRALPYLFDRLMNSDTERMLLEMPAPAETIAENLGMPAARVTETLRGLYLCGWLP